MKRPVAGPSASSAVSEVSILSVYPVTLPSTNGFILKAHGLNGILTRFTVSILVTGWGSTDWSVEAKAVKESLDLSRRLMSDWSKEPLKYVAEDSEVNMSLLSHIGSPMIRYAASGRRSAYLFSLSESTVVSNPFNCSLTRNVSAVVS